MRYAVVLLLMLGGVLWWKFGGCSTCPLQQQTQEHTEAPPPIQLQSLPVDKKMERVPFVANPTAPMINSACPVEEDVVKEAIKRNRDLGFQGEKNLRPWSDVEKRLFNGHPSFEEWKKTLRHFLVAYMKVAKPVVPNSMGVSASEDILDSLKYAICDEIAIIHFLVEKGIDPAIGQEWEDAPKIAVTKEERIILEILYRSCHMTAEHMCHLQGERLARVTFSPSPDDWEAIKKAFDIDPNRGDEFVCTYRPVK